VTLNLVLKTAVRHGWLGNAPEAEYWARAQGAGEEFAPIREQVETQKRTRAKGRSR
jgi:hypothetical protein